MRKLILACLLLIAVQYSAAQKPFALIELFTSEGCSSCPPAEAVLNKIHKDAINSGENIYTLAFHVDYWNRLGWKDPYGKFQFTERQENYSRVLPEKEVYTPQAVINGALSFVGSKSDKMNSEIKIALSQKPALNFELKKDSIANDTLFVSYSIGKIDLNFVLRLALTEDGLSSNVTKGENAGKTLSHEGVVRTFISIDKPSMNGNGKISLASFSGKGKRKLIAFVQHKQNMKVLAAAVLNLN